MKAHSENQLSKPSTRNLESWSILFLWQSCLDEIASSPGIPPPQVSASLCKELEVILKAGADLAESSCTRDYRQHTIISQSGALKEQLQTLMDSEDGGDEEGKRKSLGLARKHSTTLKQEVSAAVEPVNKEHIMTL